MIQQVTPGEPLRADDINEIVNWCNDFENYLTEAVERVREQLRVKIHEIMVTMEKPDTSDIERRLTALENTIPTILPAFSNAFMNMLATWQVNGRDDKQGVDTTLYSTGRIDLTVETYLNLAQATQTDTTYTYHYPKPEDGYSN